MAALKRVEKKGDVVFFKDAKGVMYQKLGATEPYKVRDGSITYSEVTKVGLYTIKYNNNGIYGFAIFRGRVCLEAGFWQYEKALKLAQKM